MISLRDKKIDLYLDHISIKTNQTIPVSLGGGDSGDDRDKLTIKIVKTNTTYNRWDYPIIEHNQTTPIQLVEELADIVKDKLKRTPTIKLKNHSDCDIKVSLYKERTLDDRERIAIDVNKNLSNIVEFISTLDRLRTSDPSDETNPSDQSEETETNCNLCTSEEQDETDPSELDCNLCTSEPSETNNYINQDLLL